MSSRSASTTDEATFYELLGVAPSASLGDLRAAYRRAAHRLHPDRATVASDPRAMAAVNEAWFVLRDPIRRSAYDAELGGLDPVPEREQTHSAGTAGASSTPIGRIRQLMVVSIVWLVIVTFVFMLIALAQSG